MKKTVYNVKEVLDTPNGRIAAAILRAGGQLGTSSRADGTVTRKNGADYVDEEKCALDTWDFVFGASTHGAEGPSSLTEAERKEAESLTEKNLRAVQGLVNETSDIEVLLAVNRIVSALDTSEHHALKDTLLEQTQKGLRKAVGIPDKVDPPPAPRPEPEPEEHHMEINEQELKKLIEGVIGDLRKGAPITEEQVNRIEESYKAEITKITGAKDAEVKELSDLNRKLQKDIDEGEQRMAAAEDLIDTFKEKLEAVHSEEPEDLSEAKKRIDAAEKLIEEFVKKVQEQADAHRRYEAACDIIDALVEEHKTGTVSEYLQRRMEKMSESEKEKYAPLFEGARTKEDVDKRLEALGKGAPPKAPPRPDPSHREPLPQGGRPAPLQEGDETISPIRRRMRRWINLTEGGGK